MNGINTEGSFSSEESSKIGSSRGLARIRVLGLLQHPVKSTGRFTSNFERWIELLLLTNYQLPLLQKKPHTWQYLLKVILLMVPKIQDKKQNAKEYKKEISLFINRTKSL